MLPSLSIFTLLLELALSLSQPGLLLLLLLLHAGNVRKLRRSLHVMRVLAMGQEVEEEGGGGLHVRRRRRCALPLQLQLQSQLVRVLLPKHRQLLFLLAL